MAGSKHLLMQEDLDKAASLCTSLKGHLRARFIVLSDDRTLPPPPSKPGKRQRESDEREDESNIDGRDLKKNRNFSGVAGVAGVRGLSGSSRGVGGNGRGASGRGGRGRGSPATRHTPPRQAKNKVGSGSLPTASGEASATAEGVGYFSTMEFEDTEDLPSEVDLSAG